MSVSRLARLLASTLALAGCAARGDAEAGWALTQPERASGVQRLTLEDGRARVRVFLEARSASARRPATRCDVRVHGRARWRAGAGASALPPGVVRVTATPITAAGVSPWHVNTHSSIAVRPGRVSEWALLFDWDLAHGCPDDQVCVWAFELEFEWIHAGGEALELEWALETTLRGAHWRRVPAPKGAGVRQVAPPSGPPASASEEASEEAAAGDA